MILKKKYYKRERNTFSLILSLSASSAALTNERANVFLACVFQSTQKSNLGFFPKGKNSLTFTRNARFYYFETGSLFDHKIRAQTTDD